MEMETLELLELMFMMLLMYEAFLCLTGKTARKFWVRPIYQDRDLNGFFAISFNKLYEGDPEQFKVAVRMNRDVFDMLFNLIEGDLTKYSNRPSIGAKCRLFLTLVYLAHGGSKQYFSMTFKMGLSTVKKIVKETCEALWNNLAPIYLSVPNGAEWQKISDDFESMWNFPHCVGAIDGKHITITCPPNSGSQFFNYKGTHSIVLLGVCDANYTFTGVDIGAYGSQSDGGVLWNSDFGKRLFSGELKLPEPTYLGDTNITFPYFFVGDAAFPLKTYLMRPYPGLNLSPEKETYNKRLSRARRTIENAFGILTARWRILLGPLNMSPTSAENIVKAAVVLHNFVKMHDGSYCPVDFVDQYDGGEIIKGLWRKEVAVPLTKCSRISTNNATKNAFSLRNILKDYIFANPMKSNK